MTAAILRGDARNIPLADASVDLIVTSPPYFGLRSYQDGGEHYDGQIGAEATPKEFVAALLECTREWMRVLKPKGSMWVNLGDKYNAYNGGRGQGTIQRNEIRQALPRGFGLDVKGIRTKSLLGLPWRYALRCIDDLDLILRAEVVWSKPNGMPSSVTDRVRISHETWFHLVKQPRYFSAVDEIREPHIYPNDMRHLRGGRRSISPDGTPGGNTSTCNPLGKLPGSVWEIATQPLKVPDHVAHATCCGGRRREGCEDGLAHYAAFPTEWPRRIILGWSPPGGVVLDPFGGTGTTALVADVLGRRGVSVDRSADYGRLSLWRTTDPGERARVLGKPKPPKPIVGQTDLFEAIA